MTLAASFGLAVLMVAAAALAAAGPVAAAMRTDASIRQIDTSPSTSVVAVAPLAVSVTFSGAPDPDGISLRIIGPDGEVSSGQPQLVGNAIRRTMDEDVPGGRFQVRWTARSPGGDALSGSFEFIAARGNGTYASEPARPAGFPTVQPTAGPAVLPSQGPSQPVSTTAAPATTQTVTPSTSATAQASTAVSPPPSASGPASVSSASPAAVSAAGPGGNGPASGSLSAGLKLVPITLGAVLVLASAGVGLLSSARRGAAGSSRPGSADGPGRPSGPSRPSRGGARPALLVRGGLALPWNRHQP